jgi:SAM-dependent methyltransferase
LKAIMAENHEAIYATRFAGKEERRFQVWGELTRRFFQPWIRDSDVVVDLGAGYCEFINNIRAGKKYALDLNPVMRSHCAADVQGLVHDVATTWPLASGSVDVIFSSNFLEHLHSKDQLQFCLQESHRVLRSGGRMLLLGPNIRFCADVYWDFFDHHLPLSDRSLAEAMTLAGFQVNKVIPKFLPYTMTGKLPDHPLLVRLYLALPFFWHIAGKQFFIAAEKP